MAPTAPAEVSPTVVCPKCGSKNVVESACKDCGTKITTEAASASSSGQLQRPLKPLESWRGPLDFAFTFRESVDGKSYEPNDATREIPVVIIEEGMGNAVDRHIYSADLLARSASKFNGIKAYADHPTKSEEKDQPERSVKQIVGFYKEAHIETIGGKIKTAAILKVFDGPAYDWAWQLVKEAWAYAKQFPGKNLVGISINAYGTSHVVDHTDGKPANMVDDFTEVQSADIVTAAGAGGGFRVREGEKLLEAVTKALEGQPNGGQIMDNKKTAAQLLKEGEKAANELHGLLKGHHEALKAIHAKIQSDPAYAKEYGPAMEKLMKAHEEVLKHAESVHCGLGTEPAAPEAPADGHAEPDGDEGLPKGAEKPAAEAVPQEPAPKGDGPEAKPEPSKDEEAFKASVADNVKMISEAIKGSKIPAGYQSDLALRCAGKKADEVNKLVEDMKTLIAPLFGNRAQGAGVVAQPGKVNEDSKLGAKLASSGIKMKEAAKA